MRSIGVIYLFGWMVFVLAGCMLLPAVTALLSQETQVAWMFAMASGTTAFIGGGLILALRGKVVELSRTEGLALLVFVWVFLPLAGAIPIWLAGVTGSFVRSYFEAVSGFTTTGATVFAQLVDVPNGIIIWRSLLQWLGGLTSLLTLALVIGPLIGTGQIERQLRILGGGETGRSWYRVSAFRTILPFYSALSICCFFALLACGVPAFDALCLAMSTISTGGFMPRDGTLVEYGSSLGLVVVGLFSLAGAVSIVWLRSLLTMRWTEVWQTREPFFVIGAVIFLAPFLAFAFLQAVPALSVDGTFRAIAAGFASAASYVSTTGFPVSPATDPALPYLLLLLICIIGGGRFSTAGGLKFFRLGTLLSHSGQEIGWLVYPHSVTSVASAGNITRDRLMVLRAVWANFAVYFGVFVALGCGLGFAGLDLPASLLAAVSALSNIGPAYTAMLGEFGEKAVGYPAMGDATLLGLAFGMILGRVEILALLGLINVRYWRG